MAKTLFEVLTDRIDDQISSSTEFLTAGSAKDFANYREVVGLLRGLQSSKAIVEDLSRNYGDNDE